MEQMDWSHTIATLGVCVTIVIASVSAAWTFSGRQVEKFVNKDGCDANKTGITKALDRIDERLQSIEEYLREGN